MLKAQRRTELWEAGQGALHQVAPAFSRGQAGGVQSIWALAVAFALSALILHHRSPNPDLHACASSRAAYSPVPCTCPMLQVLDQSA